MKSVSLTLGLAVAIGAGLAATTAGATPVGAIYACYACQNSGDPSIDSVLAAHPDVASDGLLFEFKNTSGAAITGGTFSVSTGAYSDTFSVGIIAAYSDVIFLPGLSNDGGAHPAGSLFATVGYTMDTSDGQGAVTDSSVFAFTGAQSALAVTSGSFTPSQSYLPFRDNPNYLTSFVGQGPNGDGGCSNCYFGKIATLSVPSVSGTPEPGAWALMIVGFGLVGGASRRRAVSPAA